MEEPSLLVSGSFVLWQKKTLHRIPDRDREDQDLANTTCLREDQWRTVPKAVNKALKSLSCSWPWRTEVYPTFDVEKRKVNTQQPPPKARQPNEQTHQGYKPSVRDNKRRIRLISPMTTNYPMPTTVPREVRRRRNIETQTNLKKMI